MKVAIPIIRHNIATISEVNRLPYNYFTGESRRDDLPKTTFI